MFLFYKINFFCLTFKSDDIILFAGSDDSSPGKIQYFIEVIYLVAFNSYLFTLFYLQMLMTELKVNTIIY